MPNAPIRELSADLFGALFGERRGVGGPRPPERVLYPLSDAPVWGYLSSVASNLALGDIGERLEHLPDWQLLALAGDAEAGRLLVEGLVAGIGEPWESEYSEGRGDFQLNLHPDQWRGWLAKRRPHLLDEAACPEHPVFPIGPSF